MDSTQGRERGLGAVQVSLEQSRIMIVGGHGCHLPYRCTAKWEVDKNSAGKWIMEN